VLWLKTHPLPKRNAGSKHDARAEAIGTVALTDVDTPLAADAPNDKTTGVFPVASR
jgi:hypothetical protein